MEHQDQRLLKRHFDRELKDLKNRILRMGGTVEDLIVRSIEALRNRDRGLATEALKIEERVRSVRIAAHRPTH